MTRTSGLLQCGTLAGLALFFPLCGDADDGLPESNYVLIYDTQHPRNSRLLIFADAEFAILDNGPATKDADSQITAAHAMTQHTNPRQRALGLTLLSGNESLAALDAAMGMLYDDNAAVREEAIQLVMTHPDGDIDLAAAIGNSDPAIRVRLVAAELAAELAGE